MNPTQSSVQALPKSVEQTASSVLGDYYELTKPGITQMVALTTLTGYYVAIPVSFVDYAGNSSNWIHFFLTMIGTIAISAGSCVFNHIAERKEDAMMKRTATRPLPSGSVSVSQAALFGSMLTAIGAAMLWNVNIVTFLLAVITWIVYVVVYTPLKKRSTLSLLIGGIPGALPFAGGWTAVRGTPDVEAWSFFAILFFWQLPHFLALSWMYRHDYREGGFVMHAISDRTGRSVALQSVMYSLLTLATFMVPFLLGLAGMVYVLGAFGLGLWLCVESIQFLRRRQHRSARRLLLTSYAALMGVLVLLIIDKV
ncbi:MAG: protoheme IX farnesyltransferase [Ignavibacteria bacterium]|nr:protoheme IX farnesyltransferase [Ignavibacteria bacterium]